MRSKQTIILNRNEHFYFKYLNLKNQNKKIYMILVPKLTSFQYFKLFFKMYG